MLFISSSSRLFSAGASVTSLNSLPAGGVKAPSYHQVLHRVEAIIPTFQITIGGKSKIAARCELHITTWLEDVEFIGSNYFSVSWNAL